MKLNPVTAHLRSLFIFACLLLLIGWLAVADPSLGAFWARNQRAMEVNRLLAATPIYGSAQEFAETPPDLLKDAAYYRNMGHRYLAVGNRAAAGQAFAAAGWSAADLAAMAGHYPLDSPQGAIIWLGLASDAEPVHPTIRMQLGQACNQDWNADPACLAFLQANGGNHFVNPDLAVAELAGWQRVAAPADYAAVPCPDMTAKMCAEITVNEAESRPPAGLSQCFHLTAGQSYRFSMWLKVTTAPDSVWRPLYFQGTIGGETRGNWQADERGASDWRYWERTFVAPAFDDGQACFSPVRLQNDAQAWFYGAEVVALTEGS